MFVYTKNMDIIVLMVLSSLLLKQASGEVSPCFDGSACQPDKPYCTSVGCVSNCPEGSFINGSSCVLHCDTGFVFEKKCVPNCPPASNLTVEKVIVNGGAFHRVQFCVESCEKQELQSLQYHDSCVSKCPYDASFVTKNVCSHTCPDGYKRVPEEDEQNGQKYVHCLQHCPSDKPYVKDDECVPSCGENLIILADQCVQNCPNDSYIIHEHECLLKCPQGTYLYNSKCVKTCPFNDVNKTFRYDGNCLLICPTEAPLVNPIGKEYTCQSTCRPKLISNTTCVDNCEADEFVSNGTCVKSCSPPMRYELIISNNPNDKRCVSVCPQGQLYDDNSCVSSCQDGKKYIDNACVTECPPKAPLTAYQINEATKLPFQVCASVCPAKTFVLNSTCTSTCPKYYYNNACVDECPTSTFRDDWTCVDKCPFSLSYIWNNTCQSMCPQFFISNKTCVDHCPDYAKYSRSKQCFEKCPNGLYSLNNICVYHCPNFTYNGSCVSRCPSDARLVNKGVCVEVCSNENYIGDGGRCVTTCGLRDNISCVHECPTTRPNNKNGVCVKSCGKGMLIQNGTCISSYDCSDKIVFEGQCLELCPVGSIYTGDNSCQSRTTLISECVVVVLFILIYCLGCAKFFKVQSPQCWRKRPRSLSIPMEDETALLPS